MPFDNVISDVSYYGGFAWMYGIKKDLWDAATRSYVKNIHQLEKPNLITLVDFRIPRNEARMWILNFAFGKPTLIEKTWVAHGSGSGDRNATTMGKSKRKSCVGGFRTGGTWKSYLGQGTKEGEKKHRAMALYGMDPTNDNAWKRGIRWHGAKYVKPGRVGGSGGCVCPPNDVNDRVVKTLAHGSFLFAYFGDEWLDV